MYRKRFARTGTGVPALAALALAVAACGPPHPGAAATVGNTRISVTALNDAVAVAVKTPDSSTGQLPTRHDAVLSSLTQLIDVQLIADGAKAKGVTATEVEIQAALAQARKSTGSDEATAAQAKVSIPELHNLVYEFVLRNNLITALAPGETDSTAQNTALSTYIATIAAHEGVSVNPRYGAYDPAHFQAVASDAFTSPVPVASASAPAG